MLTASRPTFTWGEAQEVVNKVNCTKRAGCFRRLLETGSRRDEIGHFMSSYPQGVSLQGPHHGQEERLLEQSEQSADEGLHASQAAKLRGRVPAQDKQT